MIDHDSIDGCVCGLDHTQHEATADHALPKGAAPAPAVPGYALGWLADVLRTAGLTVHEQPGWHTRGHGNFGKPLGVMLHHTAGAKVGNMPSLGVVTNGRPDLSGPLCNLALGRDGSWYVVAAGRAYHAGAGTWQGVASGNTSFIGIEAENTGVPGDSWPPVQMDSYRKGVAALLAHIGAKPIMAAGHKEFALPKGRKSDPDFDMAAFRAAAAQLMAAGTDKLA